MISSIQRRKWAFIRWSASIRPRYSKITNDSIELFFLSFLTWPRHTYNDQWRNSTVHRIRDVKPWLLTYRYSIKILPNSWCHTGVLPHSGEELQRDHPEHEGCHEHAQRHNQLKHCDYRRNNIKDFVTHTAIISSSCQVLFQMYSSVQGADPLIDPDPAVHF